MADWRETLIGDSELPTRAVNALKRGGFYTLGDVAEAEASELLRLPELGRKTLTEIEDWFADRGCLVGERRRDLERQITAMETRAARFRSEAARIDVNIAHAKARLSNG